METGALDTKVLDAVAATALARGMRIAENLAPANMGNYSSDGYVRGK